jgi:hypothetical protein
MASRLNKRFAYDQKTGQMVRLAPRELDRGTIIMDDLADFVSPVDRTIVHGRRGLREHNHRLGVTNTSDYTNTWKKAADERARHFTGEQRTTRARIDPIIRAYDDLASGRKGRRNGE